MFTGIVEGIGKIISMMAAEGRMILILAAAWLDDLKIGDSLAVNGTCLTITAINGDHYHLDVVPETLRCTNLGQLKAGDAINLERALPINGRLGGHFVQGHVDAVGRIIEWKQATEGHQLCYLAKIAVDKKLAPYLVNKGFITLDGMSLTIIEAGEDYFTVTLIPHTLHSTIAKSYHCGSHVNIETDILAKYVVKCQKNNGVSNEAN